jgi:hypothetical protein
VAVVAAAAAVVVVLAVVAAAVVAAAAAAVVVVAAAASAAIIHSRSSCIYAQTKQLACSYTRVQCENINRIRQKQTGGTRKEATVQ